MPPTLTPVYVADHVVLTGGRNLHPGQDNVQVDLDDEHNKSLLEAGRIRRLGREKPARPRSRQTTQTASKENPK